MKPGLSAKFIYIHFTLTNNWLVVLDSQLRRFIYIEQTLNRSKIVVESVKMLGIHKLKDKEIEAIYLHLYRGMILSFAVLILAP